MKNRKEMKLRMCPELHKRLKAEADAQQLPMNWLVNRAIEEYLKEVTPRG